MRKQIRKVKFGFMGVMLMLSILIATSSLKLRDEQFQAQAFLSRKSIELKYRLGYAFGSDTTFRQGSGDATKIAHAVPALVYHGIIEESDRFSMTLATFKDQMDTLHKAGWRTVSMEDFALFMQGKKSLPDKSFLLTFDDGRKDSFLKAEPLLRALDYRAVMFIPSTLYKNTSNNSYYMSTSDLEVMRRSPAWEIESHAKQEKGGRVQISSIVDDNDNFLSNRAWLADQQRLETSEEYTARVYQELHDSAKIISEKSEHPVIAFSYPFGDYGQESSNAVAIAEKTIHDAVVSRYQVAFRQIWPIDDDYSQNYPHDDMLHAKRIEVSPEWSGEALVTLLESGRGKSIPYTEPITAASGWKINWGIIDVYDGYFETYAKPTTQGSFVFLDGTLPWKEYVYTATIDWQAGSHVSLISRYTVPAYYVSCVYSDRDVRIQTTNNDAMKIYNEFKLAKPLPKENLALGMRVNGNDITCLADGKVTAHAQISGQLSTEGGIGIKTWDKTPGIPRVLVKQVSVTEI